MNGQDGDQWIFSRRRRPGDADLTGNARQQVEIVVVQHLTATVVQMEGVAIDRTAHFQEAVRADLGGEDGFSQRQVALGGQKP